MDMNENDKKAIIAYLRKIIEERLTPEQINSLDDWWLFSEDPQAQLKTFKENVKSISFEFILITILTEVAPLMAEELEKDLVIKEELKKMTDIEELMKSEPFQTILERVEDRLKEKYPTLEVTTGERLLPSIAGKRIKCLDFPVDKVNFKIWDILGEDTKGQICYISAESELDKRRGKQINILYAIDFENIDKAVSITRRLTPYDELVYIAISTLFSVGNDYMTTAQIYNAMGCEGRPSKYDIDKINNAITKMNGARIYINNLEEIEAKYKYPVVKYDGSLLPMERRSVVINGQLAEAAIHIFREPPLMSFARGRKQITTIDRKLLASPLSKTDQNIRLQIYLIDRISHIKNKKKKKISNKILFETIYKETGINKEKPKQRQRTPEKIKQLLDHYKECGVIKGYTPDELADIKAADGVTIYY